MAEKQTERAFPFALFSTLPAAPSSQRSGQPCGAHVCPAAPSPCLCSEPCRLAEHSCWHQPLPSWPRREARLFSSGFPITAVSKSSLPKGEGGRRPQRATAKGSPGRRQNCGPQATRSAPLPQGLPTLTATPSSAPS